MIRYRDSSSPDENVCPGDWFDRSLIAGIRGFRGQFGFFRFGALRRYAEVLRTAADAGHPVNLVLGSNQTDRLTIEDVLEVLGVLNSGASSHLTVVAFQNALFHPKAAHVVGTDGTESALVGSPNLTELALGTHVEAWIELESEPAVQVVLTDLRASIDQWHSVINEGVFQVRSSLDAERLLADGILITHADRQHDRGPFGAVPRVGRRGTRRARWRAPAGTPANSVIENEQELVETVQLPTAVEPSRQVSALPRTVVFRWSKRLSRSDVNKNPQNERNLLSLGVGRGRSARVMTDIDDIRHRMMADATWDHVRIGGRDAEIANVRLEVNLPGRPPRIHTLEVIHAPHRGSGQHNYHTSIRWNAALARVLRSKRGQGFASYWAILDKYDTGDYSLTIARRQPDPRSIGLRA